MKAYELLDTPAKWTKCTLARTQHNATTDSLSEEAVCWCMVGALQVCYPIYLARQGVYDRIAAHMGLPVADISWWNDRHDRKYEDVIALLKELNI